MQENKVFKRKIYTKLVEWKNKNGISSMLIEGARRVGKSTIAKYFAENEYNLIYTLTSIEKKMKI